jgi:hypothetical protein
MNESDMGHEEIAERKMLIYNREKANKVESKAVLRITKQAEKEVKENKELLMLEAVAKMAGGNPFGASHQQYYPPPPQQQQHQQQLQQHHQQQQQQQRTRDPRPPRTLPQTFTMKWVDGSLFNTSLQGVKAPDPACFPGYYKQRLDSPNNGIVHTAGWGGSCGACGAKGHSHSECPPNRWTVNGQDYVNVRWLYQKGWCSEVGAKC